MVQARCRGPLGAARWAPRAARAPRTAESCHRSYDPRARVGGAHVPRAPGTGGGESSSLRSKFSILYSIETEPPIAPSLLWKASMAPESLKARAAGAQQATASSWGFAAVPPRSRAFPSMNRCEGRSARPIFADPLIGVVRFSPLGPWESKTRPTRPHRWGMRFDWCQRRERRDLNPIAPQAYGNRQSRRIAPRLPDDDVRRALPHSLLVHGLSPALTPVSPAPETRKPAPRWQLPGSGHTAASWLPDPARNLLATRRGPRASCL